VSKWETVKISDVGKIVTGNTPSTKNSEYYSSEDIAFYKPNDLTESEVKYLDRATQYVSNSAKSKIRLLPLGSVLVTCIGTIGKVGVALHECTCNQQINAVIPGSKVISQYLAYCIMNKKRHLQDIANAPIVPIINKTQFSNIDIPLPPLETQKQIAKTLDTAAELLAMRKQQLAELDDFIKSEFYNMFGDPVTNEKGWEVSTVNKVCSKIIGGGTPSKSNTDYYVGNIPWVTPKDMKTILIYDSIDHINEKAIENSSTNLIPSNSILMVIRSGILKKSLPVAINTVNVTVNQDMKAFITNNKVTPQYLLYFFISMQNNILKNVRAVTADNIEFGLIKNLYIQVPPISIQNQFAEIVTKIEEQKTLVKRTINETQYLFDSLMSEYFD
jgi:type I restriction enzyme S subunit